MGEKKLRLDFDIRKMSTDDLPSVARIHKKTWREDHFSSKLNISMLSIYYGYLLKFNDYCFIAEKKGKLIGFVVAGDKTRQAIKEFVKGNMISMVHVTVRNTSFLLSRIKNFTRIMFSSKSANSIAGTRLLSIGVDPEFEGYGIGAALMRKVEESVRNDGIDYIGLSVHKNNKRAIELYNRSGWQVEKVEDSAFYYYLKLN